MGYRAVIRVHSQESWNSERQLYCHHLGRPAGLNVRRYSEMIASMTGLLSQDMSAGQGLIAPECDGMLSLMRIAWQRFQDADWKLGRAGKVASMLCAIAPTTIEPEDVGVTHPDWEWQYDLHLCGPMHNGSDRQGWEVTVRERDWEGDGGIELIRNEPIQTAREELVRSCEDYESAGIELQLESG